MSITPLPVYPRKPSGADLELIKQAKANIQTSLLVQPVNAVPGSPGRILALRQRPNFICDYAFVQNVNEKSIKAALEYCLGINDDPRGITVVMMLKEVFGDGVKEIEDIS